jgi:predicted deacetylase
MDQNQEFLDWLRRESSSGTEIFLHGFRHWMPERLEGLSFRAKRSLWGHWINNRWVNNEAEFCGLPEVEKVKLLRLGMSAFTLSQIKCSGFVAPTWHGTPAIKSLQGEGLLMVESRFFVRSLKSAEKRFVPPLAWNQSDCREATLVGGYPWLKTLLQLPLIKVSIHPGDFQGTGPEKIVEQVLSRGTASTYAELFEPM